MKRISVVLLIVFLMCSCGVGVHSMSSGVEQQSALTFIADTSQNITVIVDGQSYSLNTVKLKTGKTALLKRLQKTLFS